MRRKIAIARALKNLAPFTAAIVILTSGAAYAQMTAPNSGLTSISPGMPSASSPVGRSGIPFGATELGTGGLSPPPFATTSGLGTTGLGATGLAAPTSSFGAGLSPGVMPPQTMAVSPGTTATSPGMTTVSPPTTIQTPAITNRRVTNYGPGGTQLPPGTPSRFH
jgi:hypothetical protein